jgi:hypothetical protein
MRVLWSRKSMKFLYFLSVGFPLCFQVYPGTCAVSTWSIDVLDPGWLSSFVMDPRCLHVATCRCALI